MKWSSGLYRYFEAEQAFQINKTWKDKPLKDIEFAFPELEFDEPRVLDAGELGIEADIKGARIKVAIRRKNLYCEIRSRKKNQRIWLEEHFAMLGKSELLRKDGVFLPNYWKRGNMTDDIEEMLYCGVY